MKQKPLAGMCPVSHKKEKVTEALLKFRVDTLLNKLSISTMLVFVMLTLIASTAFAHGDSPTDEGHHERNPETDVSADSLTYYADIEPIFRANCAGCHQAGGIGHALLDIDDLSQVTDPDIVLDIAYLTDIGYMPPWPPSELSQPLAHERTLTDDEIARINQWAANGAPRGDVNDRVELTEASNIPTIEPNRVLTMPEPYTPTGEQLDDYRCFLLDPQFEQDTLITATDFKPGNAEIAHHAIFFIIDEQTVPEAQRRSGADGRAGWECFGGIGLQGTRRPSLGDVNATEFIAALAKQDLDIGAVQAALQARRENNPGLRLANAASLDDALLDTLVEDVGIDLRQLLSDLDIDVATMSGSGMGGSAGGWVPGSVPLVSPDNTGILVPAGSQIVLQMHYNLYSSFGSDQSAMLLETTPMTDDMTALISRPLLAPVEIPCPDGVDTPACDREVARQDTVNPNTSDMLLSVCGQTLATYADNTADNAYGYCDYPVNEAIYLLSVGPHMHELGKATRITVNPDTPDETILIDIPEWDFHWQGQYNFAQPIQLNAGDVVRFECWWDNSDGNRYIVWGEGTQDEMCFNFTRYLQPDAGKTLADYGFVDADE